VSRRYEAEADWIALRTTDDPASFVQLERKLVLSGLADPAPPGWFSFAFATHPSAMKRIAMAEAFRARSKIRAVPPERAVRHKAASSVAPVSHSIRALPASWPRIRPSHPGDEPHSETNS
jgi:hypothetical protein